MGTLDHCLVQRKPKQFSIRKLREYQEQASRNDGDCRNSRSFQGGLITNFVARIKTSEMISRKG